VPAAAVIPAPRVYTKAVAVKTLVVEFRSSGQHPDGWPPPGVKLGGSVPAGAGEERPKNARDCSRTPARDVRKTRTDKGGRIPGYRLP